MSRLILAAGFFLWTLTAHAQISLTGAGLGAPSSGGGALSCSYTPVTTGTQSVAYTGATPSASGGTPAYTFSETGSLPSGLTISSSTGVISGTPSASGTFPTIQVKVTDSVSTVANCGASFTLTIASSGCSQATAFIARETSHVNDTTYTTMICGLVTDGVWAKLDLLYFFAAPNTTDAQLNMVGVTTTSLSSTAPTFTANTGYTGNGGTGATAATVNATGYNYSTGTNYKQNAASLFVWNVTPGAADNGTAMGNSISLHSEIVLSTLNFGSTLTGCANCGTAVTSSTLASDTGLITISTTSATQEDLYQNATNIGTTAAGTTLAVSSATAECLSSNGFSGTTGVEAICGVGGGLTSTDVSNLYSRVHTALHAINSTSFP